MLTCRQITELMSKGQDDPLRLSETIFVRLHLLACAGCRNFARQMNFLRQLSAHISGRSKRPQ
jgi:hypothetical protein